MTELSFYRCCAENPLPGAADNEPGPTLLVAPAGELPVVADTLMGPEVSGLRLLPPTRRMALHEGAHSAARVALGGTVLSVTIEMQPHASGALGLGPLATNIVTLAGPACDGWCKSSIARVDDAELAQWIEAIRLIKGGACDRCRAVRRAVVETRDAPDATVAAFRQAEHLAGIIVRHPPVWQAINEIADRLMEHGTLDGAAVHEICARHFEPGIFHLGD